MMTAEEQNLYNIYAIRAMTEQGLWYCSAKDHEHHTYEFRCPIPDTMITLFIFVTPTSLSTGKSLGYNSGVQWTHDDVRSIAPVVTAEKLGITCLKQLLNDAGAK